LLIFLLNFFEPCHWSVQPFKNLRESNPSRHSLDSSSSYQSMSVSSVTNTLDSSSIISSRSSPPGNFLFVNQQNSETENSQRTYLNAVDSIDHIFNPFRLSDNTSSFNQTSQSLMDLEQQTASNHLIKSLTNLNMLNQSFSSSLLFKPDSQDDSNNNVNPTQQCGICGKYPMINGKTLVGCLHSFCQSCLMSNNPLVSASSIIACPICSQETLIPNGGIDALMPHYSNPVLSLNKDMSTRGNSNGNNNVINSACSTTASSPVGSHSNGKQVRV